ncbi:hypothetical protein COCOR_00670 [Corallococcus coralloides DSM 2259]|uniref:Uncharacterized protein n=1 Tax=Corallococcus coralloides (strain ATCC 25202 / DSM 2259 / NBRC 100086 / M2) TaxID=1144275 RepID=H8MG44_CORCM|nr:hypothetical protein [Corallococcus coralloides]AFE03630.1 hypothetical protein COCOR_00670 [Corallococcus coralloides DSM 2259]
MARGSELHAWLSRCAPGSHQRLHECAPYRHLLHYAQNELGVVCIEFSHSDEKNFFERAVPVFAIPAHKPGAHFPFNLLHDLRHYAAGDFVPYCFAEDGSLLPLSKEEYTAITCLDESDATWFSDVFIPNRLGHGFVEEMLGCICGAHAFEELGITDEAQVRQAMRSIEFEGIVPAGILRHERFRGEVRELLVNRYLRYHVLDRRQGRARYEAWMRQPATALTWLRFCNVFNDPKAYEANQQASLERILEYREAFNPLRALIARTLNFHLRVTALSLAFAREVLLQDGAALLGGEELGALVAKLARDVDALHDRFIQLKAMSQRVQGCEPTAENLQGLRMAREFQRDAAGLREDLRRLHADARMPARLQAMHARVLSFYDAEHVDMSGVEEDIEACLARSRALAGL